MFWLKFRSAAPDNRARSARWWHSSPPMRPATSPGNPSTWMAAGKGNDPAVYRLDGKVALVTGGYGGIGEAVSRLLIAAGAQVAIAGHNAGKAAACAAALHAHA